ncbi:prostaglandin G/H synthase 1-like [Pleurodeles waltl]|uniref:prostaglandin G/H synthase 1-like n=1 Tax=Pleurodeles waltl TaxID=8319 RepID=UPI0037094F42
MAGYPVLVVALLLYLSLTSSGKKCASADAKDLTTQWTKPVNPCCYYPCQHSGVCTRYGVDRYECDCTGTGYFGTNCTEAEFWTGIHQMLKPTPAFIHYVLTRFKWFWEIINRSFLANIIMRAVLTARANLISSPPTYNSAYGYLNWESYSNLSYYTRLLPPVPDDCPTPMGSKGFAVLPDAQLVAEQFLLRRTFVPDPQKTNLMFAFFAQHFTHQFFRTYGRMGRGFTKGLGHGVDMSQVYGDTLERQAHLRLFKDGKLKYQIRDGEVYPPTVAEAPIHMNYPENIPPERQLAIGEEHFGLLPGLMMYGTLWLREHNRVCDILKNEHPTWDDEQLYQTARLILIGETIKIVIEDYVQHLSGYNFKLIFNPELLFGVQFQYQNRIALEFNQLYHWHGLMPNTFILNGKEFSYGSFLFNSSILLDHGVETLVKSFTIQRAGRIGGGRNLDPNVLNVAVGVIEESRLLKLRPFNEYRKRFKLKPYESFEELTGEKSMSKELEKVYGHIDAMEFYPALLVEKPNENAIFGESIIEMGAPFSLKGLMGNPICSPEYWKPSTFGGKTGFDIVNTASLERLVCLNVKNCPPNVAFHTPDCEDEEDDSTGAKHSTEL